MEKKQKQTPSKESFFDFMRDYTRFQLFFACFIIIAVVVLIIGKNLFF